MGRQLINDAIEGAVWLTQQLQTIKTKPVTRKFPEFMSPQLISLAEGIDAGDETFTYQLIDQQGRAKIVAHNARDLPVVTVSGGAVTHRIHTLATTIEYSIQDMNAGAKGNFSLVQAKLDAERKAHFSEHDLLSWRGDATFGVWGLLNHPAIPRLIAANQFDGTSTGGQILAVMNLMVERQAVLTNNVEKGDTLAMSTGPLSFISSTPRSTVSDKTILEYFLAAHKEITQVEPIHWFDGQGTNGGDVMSLYNRAPENIQRINPVAPTALTPQAKGLVIEVPMYSRHGGVAVYYPRSAIIVENI